ncbi:MAG: sulfite exporter TauE/SafE family protein [Actinomycetota bacterium]|nr:sulfite exporter TauE/SafE family protein [Actinomycetota bacterium]
MQVAAIAGIGIGIGFLGGLFGKGGSAMATPLLAAVGVPPLAAVAAPLPATIPSTATAGWAYWRAGHLDPRVASVAIAFGVPATLLGALATQWVDGSALLGLTEVLLVIIGLRFVLVRSAPPATIPAATVTPPLGMIAAVAIGVGLVSGLLANSGGALLAPMFVTMLRLPLKAAFASSLAVAAVLAIPGTLVHAFLGHIDWALVAVFAATSIPLSYVGARVAIKADVAHLERAYGVGLTLFGAVFLLVH